MPELGDPTTLPDLARFVLALLLDVSLKAMLLLLLAGLVAGLLRRASAATRHLAWTLAVCAALLLPVLVLTVPAWRVPALARVPFFAGAVAPLAAAPPALAVRTPLFSLDAPFPVHERGQVGASPDAQPSGASASPAPYPKALVATLAGWYEAVRSMHWAVWLLLVWLVGAGVIVSRLIVGAGGVLWLALGARRIDDPSWLAQAEAVGRELGLRRTVRLLRSLGDVEAASETGDVYAASSGVIRARTVDGDVVLRTASFGEARSVNGDIHARIGRTTWNGELPFRTETGDITVDLPADAETAIDLYVGAEGSLRTALPLRRRGNETGTRLFGILGSGERLLSVHTTRGDVAITYAGTRHLEPFERYELRPELDQSQQYRADADNARRSETRGRSAVEGVLAAIDATDVQTLSRLALHDARVAVRTAATEALTQSDCPDVLLVLKGALDDVHRDVRRTAARGLGAYQNQLAIEALRGALDDAQRTTRSGSGAVRTDCGRIRG